MKCDPLTDSNPLSGAALRTERRARETPLPSPEKIRNDIPFSQAALSTVARGRQEIADILSGRDSERLLIVCGPCSIDDINSALVYAEKLSQLARRVEDRTLLVMRTYFEKPRSVVGWKGLLYDPLLPSERTASSGISIARRLLARVNEMGLPCATEFLSPLLALYLEDAITYGSIGSRTVESQIHRELASRLSMPVGMKNAMDGDPKSALNAMEAASAAHTFYEVNYRGQPCMIEVEGNSLAHVILRGGSNGPNFDAATVSATARAARREGLTRPVLVDCSHGNSQKDHRRQAPVAQEVVRQYCSGERALAGLMLESHLMEGRQDAAEDRARRFGQSITDACIGWADTEKLVLEIASSV